jgi:3,4-dihydroxy 2-butanone 4-phosphate synthase/GTP cyclohydrolase II
MEPSLQVIENLSADLASPEELIEEARAGRMFILIDDEDRENEGDLIIPAQMATPDAINFMAREGRGLVCLAMEGSLIDRLNLPLMGQQQSRMQTAFTVSIEAREGVTTGISAADRARTIQVAIAPNARADDIVTPGHVFPLRAREGGVLMRAGHTEAAVDIARLAGLIPAGVICEIMKDDGSMARLPDLIPYARRHNLKIGTIADLIAYRRKTEKLVDPVRQEPFTRHGKGGYTLHTYINRLNGEEHLALVKGQISGNTPALVRVHVLDAARDCLGGDPDKTLQASLDRIEAEGRGVLVLIREAYHDQSSEREEMVRDYGIGVQILADLGVSAMTVLTDHPRSVAGLDAYGLHIVGHKAITQ